MRRFSASFWLSPQRGSARRFDLSGVTRHESEHDARWDVARLAAFMHGVDSDDVIIERLTLSEYGE